MAQQPLKFQLLKMKKKMVKINMAGYINASQVSNILYLATKHCVQEDST